MSAPLDGHHARRRFGQNFLTDAKVIGDIVASIAPMPGDHLLEIGPGLGALTRPLLAGPAHLTAIEIDRDLASRLAREFATAPHFSLVQADALSISFASLRKPGDRLRLVGNLPYNITTPLLLHALAQLDALQDLHVMVQREVALRLAAPPGNSDYGRLGIACQAACEVECLLEVPPESFEPAPRVFSSVVRLQPRVDRPSPALLRRLGEITQIAFSQRRKMIRQTLGKHFSPAQLSGLDVPGTARPEEIPVATYVALAALSAQDRSERDQAAR